MSKPFNPILQDFPDSFETERLIIRTPRPGDGAAIAEAVTESLEHLRPWMPWAKQAPTVEDMEARVREGIARWIKREDMWLQLISKADGRYIGGSGLHQPDWEVRSFEIGYWVRASEEGKGYITEAVSRITDYAFNVFRAQRVMIRCDSRNTRSASVARRCGYTFEGTHRRDSRGDDGDLRDTLTFSMIRTEWEARQK
jgi:ribosomal-protein-serine acetyltransferase